MVSPVDGALWHNSNSNKHISQNQKTNQSRRFKKKGALHFTNQCLPTKMFSKNLSTIYGLKPLVNNSYDVDNAVTPYRTPWCCKGRSSNDRPSASMIPQISPEASESDPEDSLIDDWLWAREPRTGRFENGNVWMWMWMCRSAFVVKTMNPNISVIGSHEYWLRNQKNRFTKKSRSTTWMDVFAFFLLLDN